MRLDVDPASGRGFLTGDAVNVAARLQAAAPPGGVAVGALTHELTAGAIEYDELPPVSAKGKAEPVPAWLALRPVARTGLRTLPAPDAVFVGREKELSALLAAFGTAAVSKQVQFVLLVGEPGIGKSRLVLELARELEAHPELVRWRQGRCLAYGDGSGFAALVDILKAQAGIVDSDDVATAETKLDAILPEGEDRAWLRQRLRPLLGLEATEASREESFAAWTIFLRDLASAGPTVLVMEDLHWSGEGMLALLEHVTTQELAVPLLFVATTRPELLAEHPDVLVPAKESNDSPCRRSRDATPGISSAPSSTGGSPRPCASPFSSASAATRSTPKSTCACCSTEDCCSRGEASSASRKERSSRCPTRCKRCSLPASTRCRPNRRHCSATPRLLASAFGAARSQRCLGARPAMSNTPWRLSQPVALCGPWSVPLWQARSSTSSGTR